MDLSEELKIDDDSGDFGSGLEGYSERALELEQRVALKDHQIAFLWRLLDDISTAGDMRKPEINGYFRHINKLCDQRELVANSPDGNSLEIKELNA